MFAQIAIDKQPVTRSRILSQRQMENGNRPIQNMDTLDISSQIPMERQQTTNTVKMQWKLKRAIYSQNAMANTVKIPCDGTPPRIHRAVGRV